MSGLPSRRPPGAAPPRHPLAWLILLVCGAAIGLAILGLTRPARPAAATAHATIAAKPAEAPPPPVEPMIVRDLTPDDARAINAAVPFVTGAVPPAPRFAFTGPPDERERALTCLAGAVWYEAGNDPVGQQAVAQVVLNRVRHPAYPKSVCGVVFQGAERRTGCQFTFTCDGALDRHRPSPEAWKLARGVAAKALDGFVFKAVGTATHYHTDWVVPYWSETLDKIAMVHTHIFFRWRGLWGTPAVLRRDYHGPEPIDPRIVYLADPAIAPPLAPGAPVADAGPLVAGVDPLSGQRDILYIPGVTTAGLRGAVVRLMDEARGEYGLLLDATAFPGSYALAGLAICKTRAACTVAGWTKADRIPASLPLTPPMLRTVSFLYRKSASGKEDAYWNCRQFPRDVPAQCLPGTEPPPKPAPAATPAPAPATPAATP